MAQNGFHGVFGLLTGPPLARRLPLRRSDRRTFLLAFTAGNMLPDADWVGLVMVWFANRDLALTMHRGFTHSLLGAVLPIVGLGMAARMARDPRLRALGLGLGLGALAHTALDLGVWFSGVDLLWPLGYFGQPSPVNLWWWFQTPPLLGRLLAACDYLSYAIYYTYLESLAHQTGYGTRFILPLQRLRRAMAWLTGLYLVLALPLPDHYFNLLHYTLWSLVAFPTALYVTMRMGAAIGAAGATPAPGKAKRTGRRPVPGSM